MYYTYFRNHVQELRTIARQQGTKEDWFVDKGQILDHHRTHVPGFAAREQVVGLRGKLDLWYKKVSGLVHGQKPGALGTGRQLATVLLDERATVEALELYEEGVEVLCALFLVTPGEELWRDIDLDAQRALSKGLSASAKKTLGLQ